MIVWNLSFVSHGLVEQDRVFAVDLGSHLVVRLPGVEDPCSVAG